MLDPRGITEFIGIAFSGNHQKVSFLENGMCKRPKMYFASTTINMIQVLYRMYINMLI